MATRMGSMRAIVIGGSGLRHRAVAGEQVRMTIEGTQSGGADCTVISNTAETIMASKEKTLEDLFYETLKDIYFAEKAIVKALPKMAKAAHSDELRDAFEHH